MPTTMDWMTFFEKHGQHVVWHIYGDEPKALSEVPQPRYEGWFLQSSKTGQYALEAPNFLQARR